MSEKLEIPFKHSSQLLVIETEDLLANPEDIFEIIRNDNVSLEYWLKVGLVYYKNGDIASYKKLLEGPIPATVEELPFHLAILNSLAAFYVNTALAEKDKIKAAQNFEEATSKFNEADKINFHEECTWLGKGVLLLAKRNFEAAAFQFNTVLQKSPSNIPALLGQACISFESKDYSDALRKFAAVLRLHPNGPPYIRLALGYCYHKLCYYNEAKLCFQRVLSLDPKNCDALVALSIVDFSSRNEQDILKGLANLKKAYEINPYHSVVLVQLSNYFFSKKEFTKSKALATTAYNNAEKEDIKAESAYILGKLAHAEGKFADAFYYYYQAHQYNEDALLPLFGLSQCYIKKNEIGTAISTLEKILSMSPDNYECLKAKDLRRSVNLFKRAIEICPDDIEVLLDYAALIEQADYLGALKGKKNSHEAYRMAYELLNRAENVVTPLEVLNNLAVLEFQAGDLAEAISNCEAALLECQKMVDQGEVYFKNIIPTIKFNKARILENSGRLDEAEKIYQDLITENPNYCDSYLRLGVSSHKKKNFNEAEDFFKDAIGKKENLSDAWCLLGNTQLALQAVTPSRKTFERVLTKIDKHDVYSLLSLGNIYYLVARHEIENPKNFSLNLSRSLEFFQKALVLDTKNYFAANGIGIVLAAKGHLKEAKDVFLQVRQAEGDFDDVWINMGHVFMELQNYSSAASMYEHCCKKHKEKTEPFLRMYLAKAFYYLAKETRDIKYIEESIENLKMAQKSSPEDLAVRFNIALNCQEYGQIVSKMDPILRKSEEIKEAIGRLLFAQTEFSQLVESALPEQKYFDVQVAKYRAKFCFNLREELEKQYKKQLQEEMEYGEKLRLAMEERQAEFQLKQSKEDEERERQAKLQEEIEIQRKEAAMKAKLLIEKIKSKEAEEMKIKEKSDKEDDDSSQKPASKKRKRKSKIQAVESESSDHEVNEPDSPQALIADLFEDSQEEPAKRLHTDASDKESNSA